LEQDETPLIVVAGGTSESRVATKALLASGFRVLLSQATDAAFELECHPLLTRRQGRLNAAGWAELLLGRAAAALVDAAHPHAVELHQTLWEVATALKLDLLRLARSELATDGDVVRVFDHLEAARISCAHRCSVLLTVGTRQLAPYVTQARIHGNRLTARVLDSAESRRTIAELGVLPNEVVYGRGPFSLQQNLELIERVKAEVLVLKDSGKEGGMIEKIRAARIADCRLVMIARPEERTGAVTTVETLIHSLNARLKQRTTCAEQFGEGAQK
jgi:precorrin-6A/cobalt-precorrin-6A reductase